MPTQKPIILTTVSHQGVSTLDLSTVPHHLLVNIASAALAVSAEWGNGNIKTEYLGAEHALAVLSTASSSLDQFFSPTVPGKEDLMQIGLTVADDDKGYPVIRHEQIRLVKAVDLTELEKAAVRQWLTFNMGAAAQSSESFASRLSQLEQEIDRAKAAPGADYEEPPAPDWRAV